MKTLVCSLMALCFAVSMAGRAQGRNVELLVPITDAMAATDVSDRPTGTVKFFIATQNIAGDMEKAQQVSRRAENRRRGLVRPTGMS